MKQRNACQFVIQGFAVKITQKTMLQLPFDCFTYSIQLSVFELVGKSEEIDV